MPHRFSFRSGLLVGLSAVAAALLVPAVASAQADPVVSYDTLKQIVESTKNRNRFEKLVNGDEKPGADDKAILDGYAQWYVCRMTLRQFMGLARTEKSKLPLFFNDFKAKVDTVNDHRAKNQEFQKQWTASVVNAFDQVFKKIVPNAKENRLALVNTALLLPLYAKTQQDSYGQYLEKLLADEKQHEIVKLYAVKGLREYFHPTAGARAHKPSDDPEDKALMEEITRDTRRIEALLKFVNRTWKGVDPAVARYIRREAIQTLATARVPAMEVQKDGKVVAPVSYTLLRVLAPGKDGPNPPPSLPEKVEAAIGIFKLKSRDVEGYQPEVGLYLAGRFLQEFVNEYIKDYGSFGGKGSGVGRAIPAYPWRMEADRLLKALKEIQTGLRDNHPAYTKAGDLASKAIPVLSQIYVHRPVTPLPETFARALKPGSGALFKGSKQYQVDLSGAGGD